MMLAFLKGVLPALSGFNLSSLFHRHATMPTYTLKQRLSLLTHSRFLTDVATAVYFVIEKVNLELQQNVKRTRLEVGGKDSRPKCHNFLAIYHVSILRFYFFS